jgi:hypothetical protein
MFDKLLTRAHTQAQNELDEQLCRQRQSIQLSLTVLRSLGGIILDDELRARLFAAVSREELVACVDNIGEWVEHVSPIEWDNVVLYGQYILDRKLVRLRRRPKRVVLSV